ncbi:hypothetical protein DC522_15825 [Microvirga sp. KLBC 81]|uniref:SHOCT domain-containing protein n=1 Tax=Microvirga sp. KLBC 81 TaxID=1862707 RepID=UPI000D51B899|nr:SHOCT domain-containing protein [Microvirga sp. KLBC 81]PVE23463.1 hypothetical protein DC522_15825 [Microvirga sp. KLBC 81]
MQKILTPGSAAASAALILVPASVWAQAPSDATRYPYGPHMMGWGGGYPMMIFGPLFMVLFLAVLIAAVILIVRWASGTWPGLAGPHHAPPGRTPLDILKERFARGEIDKDEFEERRRVLGE